MLCSVVVDGAEVGCAVSFPTGPIRVVPTGPGSHVSLRFFKGFVRPGQHAEPQVEVSIGLSELARYGAPLYASLWLGLPALCGSTGMPARIGLRDSIICGQDPQVPKACVTFFRPVHGSLHARQLPGEAAGRMYRPDIKAALDNEEIDLCAGPVKRGPTSHQQVEGILEAFRAANSMALALQSTVFLNEAPTTARGAPSFLLWRCHPGPGLTALIHSEPIFGNAVGALKPGEVFRVAQEREGSDGILFLKLQDGRGWAADRTPQGGSLCVRHEVRQPPREEKAMTDSRRSLGPEAAAAAAGDGKFSGSKTGFVNAQEGAAKENVLPTGQDLGGGMGLQAQALQEELRLARAEIERSRAAEQQARQRAAGTQQELERATSDLQRREGIQVQEAAKGAKVAADLAQSVRHCDELKEAQDKTRKELEDLRARHQREVLRLHADLDVLRNKEKDMEELQKEVEETTTEMESMHKLLMQHEQVQEELLRARAELHHTGVQAEENLRIRIRTEQDVEAKDMALKSLSADLFHAQDEMNKAREEHEEGVAKLRAELERLAAKAEEYRLSCEALEAEQEELLGLREELRSSQEQFAEGTAKMRASLELQRSKEEEHRCARAELEAKLGEKERLLEARAEEVQELRKKASGEETLRKEAQEILSRAQATLNEAGGAAGEEPGKATLDAQVRTLREELETASAKEQLHRRAVRVLEEKLRLQEVARKDLEAQLEKAAAAGAQGEGADSDRPKPEEQGQGLLEAQEGLKEEQAKNQELQELLLTAKEGLENTAVQLKSQEADNRRLGQELEEAVFERKQLRIELKQRSGKESTQQRASKDLCRNLSNSLTAQEKRCSELEEQLAAASAKLEASEAAKADQQSALKTLQTELLSAQAESGKPVAEASDREAVSAELGALKAERDELLKKLTDLPEHGESAEEFCRKVTDLEAKLKAKDGRQQVLETKLGRLNDDLQEAEAVQVILKKAVRTAEERQKEAEGKLARTSQELAEARAKGFRD